MIRYLFCTLLLIGAVKADSVAEVAKSKRGLIILVGTDRQDLSSIPGTLVVRLSPNNGVLPLVDNLANLLVLGMDLPKKEVLRVLAPGGVAFRGAKQIIKPAIAGTDEWTHFLHGPGNNPTSKDTVVDFPRGLQWIAGPTWTRDHDSTPVISCQVTSGGRMFYVFDEGPGGVIDSRVPTKTQVIARDAYSGIILWKYRLPNWYPSQQIWGSVPVTLNQRLVAVGDTVYVTKGISGAVIALDAATGQEKFTYKGSEGTGEILVANGMLVVGIRKEVPRAGDQNPPDRSKSFKRARGVKGLLSGSQVKVFDAKTGKVRWACKAAYRASTIASDGTHILYSTGKALVCHDAATGKVVWKDSGAFSKLMLRDGVAVAIKEVKRSLTVQAHTIKNGKKLWSKPAQSLPTFKNCFYIPPETFITNGQVWVTAQKKGGGLVQLDLKTGKVTKSFSMKGGMTEGHHVRCYPAKATEKYLLFNKRGIEFVDLKGKFTKHHWVRGQCRMGILPANGMIYVPPNGCNCGVESYVRGMQALHSRQPVATVADGQRLIKGPAYGSTKAGTVAGWPTFRGDNRRTASRTQGIQKSLAMAWKKQFNRSLTTTTATTDTLFVGEGALVKALDLATGKERWRFPATIDSPPTIVGNAVLFGSTNGYVYNLRASDGKLVWRFLAAPVDQRQIAFGKLESVWPCHGSVLVRNNTVYGSAGRSSFLDGGIYLYGLDLKTGAIRYRNVLKTKQPQKTNRLDTYNCRGALSDILVTDGDRLYMRQMKLDWALKVLSPYHPTEGHKPEKIPRVLASSGFLDDSENKRIYRSAAKQWTGRYSQLTAQQLSLDGSTNYGCRVYFGRGWKSPRYHTGDGTYVFAHDLAKQPEKVETIHKKGHLWSVKGGPPDSFFIRHPKEILKWETHIPIKGLATVVAGDKLLVAGRYDRNIDDMKARAAGKDKGALCVIDKKSGKVLETIPLPCVPQLDGMLVVGNRVLITGRKQMVLFGP